MKTFKHVYSVIIVLLCLNKCLSEQESIIYPTSCGSRVFLDYAEIFFNSSNPRLSLYAINQYCYQCSKQLVSSSQPGTYTESECAQLYTPHPWTLYLISDSNNVSSVVFETEYKFGEKGRYSLVPITQEDGSATSLQSIVIEDPINSNLPVFILLGVISAILIISYTLPATWGIYKRRREANKQRIYQPLIDNDILKEQDIDRKETENIAVSSIPKPKSERLQSLDTFRGFSLYFMIFVNYGCGGYWYFDHADWNGVTIADFLFPWFMWMMGVSMALSFVALDKQAVAKGLPQSVYHRQLFYKCTKRSLIFIALGIFYANGYNYSTWRIPGVLQYFGVSYFVTTATVIAFKIKTSELIKKISDETPCVPDSDNNTIYSELKGWILSLRILLAYKYEWMVQGSILLTYLLVCLVAKVPGCPRGYNGPGGISQDSMHYECTGGIHKYLDSLLFTSKHYFQHPTCQRIYSCTAYDPEGALGSLSACTLTYLGLMSGRILVHYSRHYHRIRTWLMGAAIMLLLAGILCGFSKNEGLIPVNKNLWSTSFGLLAAGSGLICLSVTYLLVDVYKLWSGAPFLYLGMNSILIYCFHPMFHKYFPFSYATDPQSHAKLLQRDVIGVSCWLAIAFYFYKIKFFVKV